MSTETIQRYYDAFNAGDLDGMIDCLSDDFVHDVNEGDRRNGKEAFAAFCTHMNACYKEELTDLVVMASADGTRGAAEFIVNGTYLKTDGDLPEARGQTYRLPGGGFLSLKDGKITRVTTYYNLAEWVRQVS
ncbi:ketosteroid isomerase-related protein [Shimia sediminis]|uniref:ketosteroid isomerase-related protein n=1 Tax=Shimia sediminis TaxID=2497945 RepID=UPI000F8DA28E|nr:ketosteroid isomerase-related protein [Shimia sediminis]